MSLNGLDSPALAEAYEAVSAEPGGWFLLKYASRDEIELLSRGSGGISEVRNAAEAYEETSPLFGFLKYRRRNVIIRYVPDGCSRLIQARVAVHFTAVCERFSPYDSTLEITETDELKDTKLSAACSLHAASASNTSSNGSKKRLGEIAEEEEEEQRATKRQSLTKEGAAAAKAEEEAPAEPVMLNSDLAASPEQSKFSAQSTSELPSFVGVAGARPSTSSAVTIDGASRRLSTQTARPDLFSYSSYPYSKPKVKLGPRPSVEVNLRPQTAGNFRPVSSIPAGMKLFGKGAKKSRGRDDSASIHEEASGQTAPREAPSSIGLAVPVVRPNTSSGVSTAPSTATTTTITPPMPTPSKQTMNREKARLMKAMQLREKKKKLSVMPPEATPSESDIASPRSAATAPEEQTQALTNDDIKAEVEEAAARHFSMIKADSGVALETPLSAVVTDQASEKTHTDSRPTSPVVTSSEADHSTKASSLSESTDETVQEKSEQPEPEQTVIHASSEEPQEPEPEVQEEKDLVEDPASDETATPDADKEPLVVPEAEVQDATKDEEIETDAEAKAVLQQLDEDAEEPEIEVLTQDDPVSATTADVSEEAEDTKEQDAVVEPTPEVTEAAELPSPEPQIVEPEAAEAPQGLEAAAVIHAAEDAEHPDPTRLDVRASLTAENLASESAIDTTPDELKDEVQEANPKRSSKRRSFVPGPIRTDLAQQHSRQTSRSDTFSVDDALMEELQSATVEEAKPMIVTKTPISATFPTDISGPTTPTMPPGMKPHMVRTVSNPLRGGIVNSGDVSQSSARSLSMGAAYLHRVTQQQQAGANLSKKANMGSGITQRIKALEMLSVDSAQPGSNKDRPSSRFFSVKKERDASRSPSVADRASTFGRPSPGSGVESVESSPEPNYEARQERSGSMVSRLSIFESPPGAMESSSRNPSRGRPESISVTARIIRDPNEAPAGGHLELKQSPLLVDHQRAVPEDSPPLDQVRTRRSSFGMVKDFIKERRKSITSITDIPIISPTKNTGSRSPTRPPSTHQNNSIANRLSMSSRRSLSRDRDMTLSPTGATDASLSGDETKSNSDKRKSRAGRFMRRLSSLSGSRGKVNTPPGISPTLAEEDTQPEHPTILTAPSSSTLASTPAIVSYLGDVNVQFPDTLLWKRRNMCLDASGFLILSATLAAPPSQGGTGRAPAQGQQGSRRYHLSEFRTPYVPDLEVQELPNSVVLDLVEGSGVQVACEDRTGQNRVLQVLREAHAAHATFGQ